MPRHARARARAFDKVWDTPMAAATRERYDRVLDRLYGQHGLSDRRQTLANLAPLLTEPDRDVLVGAMRAAGYGWRGLTD